jgi:hypothetical protein
MACSDLINELIAAGVTADALSFYSFNVLRFFSSTGNPHVMEGDSSGTDMAHGIMWPTTFRNSPALVAVLTHWDVSWHLRFANLMVLNGRVRFGYPANATPGGIAWTELSIPPPAWPGDIPCIGGPDSVFLVRGYETVLTQGVPFTELPSSEQLSIRRMKIDLSRIEIHFPLP